MYSTMTEMLQRFEQNGTRLLQLRKKLKAREGKAGYEKNCEHLRDEILRLEQGTST